MYIKSNFVECLFILLYGAIEPMGYSEIEPAKIRSLIEKETFVSILWNASTSSSLNKRTVGSLEETLGKVEQKLKNKGLFKRPKWWNVLLNNENIVE